MTKTEIKINKKNYIDIKKYKWEKFEKHNDKNFNLIKMKADNIKIKTNSKY